MAKWATEAEARDQIKEMVTEYYYQFKEKKNFFQEGDRICLLYTSPSPRDRG